VTSDQADFAALTPLLAPRSVAVVGASDDPRRIGGRPIAYMLTAGYAGHILPVNPNRATVQGLTAYPSVADLPVSPDVAILAVPAALATEAMRALAARGTRAVVAFTAGFAEVDEAGATAQAELVAIAQSAGMRLLGPNCLGLFDGRAGYYATFTNAMETGFPIAGRIGIASQSGAYGTHVFAAARNRRIGTSVVVTTGNEADVTVGELIGWMAGHDGTDVIAAYMEGIKHGPDFLAALTAARAARKPVVVMKVGRSALGRAAALSHTASIAGDDAVIDAVLAEYGVIRARSTEEMLDIAYTATARIYPVRNTLGVLTVSGGAGVLVSDAAEAAGVAMPAMPQAAQDRLRGLISFSAPRNPVDATAQVFNDFGLAAAFTESMVADGGYDSNLLFFSQTGGGSHVPALRSVLRDVRAKHPDRLYVLSVIASPEIVADYESDGMIVHEDPTRAVVAIAAMGRLGEAFAAAPGAPPPPVAAIALPAATPDEATAKALLAQAGIAGVPEQVCRTADEAVAAAEGFGFPVVLKIVSPDILHKSEVGGVLLGVTTQDAVRAGYALLLDRAAAAAPAARIQGVLVARQLSGGTECILGIQQDPVFGPVAVFGLGGVFVEVLRDVVLHRCPFGVDVAERMIRSIRGAPLLLGARGRPPADISALALMLARLSVFAHQAGPRLRSIDLNPVFALPDGAYAADAVIEIGEEPA
jgi:acyl-CoA synthetase (NDP forming)